MLELALELEGHAVTTSRSVADGRRALAATTFDVILLDLGLGDGSGLDLLRYIRAELGCPTPVLILSGQRQRDTVRRAQELGAASYLMKPFSPNDVLGYVEKLAAG